MEVRNPKRKQRKMAVKWNKNYENLNDGYGEYKGATWISQLKRDICDELDICPATHVNKCHLTEVC